MSCVIPNFSCPHPRAMKPIAPIMYHHILHHAGKSTLSGVESKDHRADTSGQFHKGGAEVIPNSQVQVWLYSA